jgi:hypothetical protein
MNVVLTINKKFQAAIFHDQPLGFVPAWVEFARDARGIRIIGMDGQEYLAGVNIAKNVLPHLDDINDIVLIWMENGKAMEGYQVTFVNQYYEGQRRKGAKYGGSWNSADAGSA